MVYPTSTIRSCSVCLIRRNNNSSNALVRYLNLPMMMKQQQQQVGRHPPRNCTISTLIKKSTTNSTTKSASITSTTTTTTTSTLVGGGGGGGGRRLISGGRNRKSSSSSSSPSAVPRATTRSSFPVGHQKQRRKATLAKTPASTPETAATTAATTTTTGGGLSLGTTTRKGLVRELGDILGRPRTIPIPRWVSPNHYSITLSECLGHASFILVAISYAVDDFLTLRIIAVAGSTCMLFFSWFHPHGRILWLPFKWNCLFIAINSYRIGKVYWDRYLSEQLTHELRETRSKHFYLMDPVDFGRLARIGTIETYRKGDILVEQDTPNSNVRVVLSGGLKVMRDDKITYTLEEGNFVSESGLHAGLMLPYSVDSCCSIVAETDNVRLLTWDRTELVDLLNRSPHVRRSLKAVLSWDIVRKLKAQRLLLSDGIIHDAEAWTQRRHEQTEHRYTAILKNILNTTHDQKEMTKRKQELNQYRTIHHIDDEHHREALTECGWTVEQFDQGYREEDEEGDEDGSSYNSNDAQSNNSMKNRRHGPQWYVREAIMRIVD